MKRALSICSISRTLLAPGPLHRVAPATALIAALSLGLMACGDAGGGKTDTEKSSGDDESTQGKDSDGTKGDSKGDSGDKSTKPTDKDSSTGGDATGDEATGTKPDSTDTSREALSPDNYCAELSRVVCEGDATCCTDDAKKFSSEAECQTEIKSRCAQDVLGTIKDERTGFDGTIARTQLDRLEGFVKTCDLETAAWFVESEGMMSMYTGTVDSGGACTPSDTEDAGAMLSCKKGHCLIKPFPLSGTCTDQGRAEKDTCYAHVECAEGLYCTAPTGGSGTCEKRGANGTDCGSGLACSSYYCESRKCVPATKNLVYCAK